jgi:CRAL/TRIO domain
MNILQFTNLGVVLVYTVASETSSKVIVVLIIGILAVSRFWRDEVLLSFFGAYSSLSLVAFLSDESYLGRTALLLYSVINSSSICFRKVIKQDAFKGLSVDAGFFYSLDSSDVEKPFLTPLLLPQSEQNVDLECLRSSDVSIQEYRVIEELKILLQNFDETASWTLIDYLKLAWSRKLDPNSAMNVFRNHLKFTREFDIAEIPLSDIQRNFTAGFSVKAGRDLIGRVLLWQRMKYMKPSEIQLSVGIKSTWLALDAALSEYDCNRLGCCLVYDFTDIGISNVTLHLNDIKNGALACATAHPSHISRVIFLNAPIFFKICYSAVQPMIPREVTEVVEFKNITPDLWYETICEYGELPRYLRERTDSESDCQEYLGWLLENLKNQHPIYLNSHS